MKSNLHDIEVQIHAITDKACLVSLGDRAKAVWIPKSQAELDQSSDIAPTGILTAPEWLLLDKGLI